MMKIHIKLFGIAKEIAKNSILELELSQGTVADLRSAIMTQYPKMGDLKSVMVAVNSEYANDDVIITEKDEVALIPPVSGG